jgi:hypothetical protein
MDSGNEDAFFAEKADDSAAAFAHAALRRAKDPSPHSVRLKPDATSKRRCQANAKGSRLAQRAVKSGRHEHEKRCGAPVAEVPG